MGVLNGVDLTVDGLRTKEKIDVVLRSAYEKEAERKLSSGCSEAVRYGNVMGAP